jgi:hypothetical protein
LIPAALLVASTAGAGEYPWHVSFDAAHAIERRIPPPPGYERAKAAPGSFAAWLRGLPLKPGSPKVRLFDGRLKQNQDAHAAIIEIDTGTRDLQQCADAVIRLRAEWLFAKGRALDASFHFTSGDACPFRRWAAGERPVVTGSRVAWTGKGKAGATYARYREWLDEVFTYAGTISLDRELKPVKDPASIGIGDVFIEAGSPGHAVIVVDLAADPRTGEKVFLLAQSYMPAQEMHVLKSPDDLSPWYRASFGAALKTPEWTFKAQHLKGFPE